MVEKMLSKEPRYNLSYVVQETGIKADTLRAWERRYQVPKPQRTKGGHRLFSEFDIQTIKWLTTRQKEGLSISRAVRLWREMENKDLETLSPTLTGLSSQTKAAITVENGAILADMQSRWIQACLNFNEPTAEQVLSQAFAEFPPETVCVEILQYGLSAIGALWQEGGASVQQEHFTSELATRRIHALVEAAPKPVREKTILVGCPPDENHTFSALLTSLLLRYRAWPVIFLGADVPRGHLIEAVEKTNPALVVMAAMRLMTAASLYDAARSLKEIDIPLAFGGWVFEHIPGLAGRIPGHYLGGDVSGAISKVENLLAGSIPQIAYEQSRDDFSETISHFTEMKHRIGDETLNKMRSDSGKGVSVNNIQIANEFLSQEITAALSLGDLSFVRSDIEWAENLIINHGIPGRTLSDYLLAYYETAQIHLDEPGEPILDWLASIIQIGNK
jgi:DNA-binding transcriptional MerR regulator